MRVGARRRGGAPLAAPAVGPVPAEHHNKALEQAQRKADGLEDALTALLIPVLLEAGDAAARNFEAMATDHLAASGIRQRFPATLEASARPDGVNPRSTMIAVKPRPDEAAALADPDGADPSTIHVTLAYLGETEGPLSDIVRVLAGVPGEHAPLEGQVGGVGCFADNGKGHPAIALPSVPGLIELRQHVAEKLTDAGLEYGRDYGYQPHMTIAYRDDPTPPDIALAGKPLHFDDLWVVRGDVDTAQLPLVGAKPVTAAGEQDPDDEDGHDRLMGVASLEDIAAVAEEHAPDGGYGDTWWNEEQATVYWVPADWTTNDEIEAAEDAFLDLDGVEQVEVCDECGPPSGDGWERLYAVARWTLTAAGDGFCLPASVRGVTDPVRQAAAQSIMKSSLEHVGIAFDPVNPLAAKVLAQSGSQIVGISQTTQLDVMKTIRAAHDEGLSIPDTAKSIRAVMADTAPWRARLIARTELAGAVHGGSLAATQIVSEVTDTRYTKTWRTAPGAQYPRHENYDGLDGQTVGLDQTFDVGGADLQFPGDPSGPPEEVCNCRCSMTYEDAGGGGEVEASASPARAACAHHDGPATRVDLTLASIRRHVAAAATPSPARWTAPAPEEVLPINCDARLPATTGIDGLAPTERVPEPVPAGPLPGPPVGDTVSVGPAPYLPQTALSTIERLGLDAWPPEKGPEALRILGPATDTQNLYAPGGVWDTDRAALHQEIVDKALAGKVAAKDPTVYFTAGGGASGKSGLTFQVGSRRLTTDALGERRDTVLIDPDAVKRMLPEFQELYKASDPYASMAVHEESSLIAKQIAEEAEKRGVSYVLDTTASSGSFVEKIDAAVKEGYQTQVAMMSIPTNEAIMRSLTRALGSGPSAGRFVPLKSLKYAHAGASRNAAIWMHDKELGPWTIWDNSGPKPTLVAEGEHGQVHVLDQGKLDEILAKGDEGQSTAAAASTPAPVPVPAPMGEASTVIPTASMNVGSLDAAGLPAPAQAIVADAQAAISRVIPIWRDFKVTELPDSDSATARALADGGLGIHSDSGAATLESAIVHEFGHQLDREILGTGTEFGTETSALDPLYQILKASPTMQAVRNDEVKILEGDPQTRNQLLQGKEMFARAFEEYVAINSGDPVLVGNLDKTLADKYLGFQYWPRAEFEPIRAELDRLFEEKGLVEPAAVDLPPGALEALDATPVSGDAYVASLQVELRKLGKSIAANNYQLKTETRVDRRAALEQQIKAWEVRRDDVRALIATPDPKGELARLGKQIAASKFEIKNGRGNPRLEARLKALERRRDDLRKVMGGPLKPEIQAQEAKVKVQRQARTGTTTAPAGTTFKPGEVVDATHRGWAYSDPGTLQAQLPGTGPENYVELTATQFTHGNSVYEMGPSVVFQDADTGTIVRTELDPNSRRGPEAVAQDAARALHDAFDGYPEAMQGGQLRQLVYALGRSPNDEYWQKTMGDVGHKAAASADYHGTVTYWNGNRIDSVGGSGQAIFDHEMGHITGVKNGPPDVSAWDEAKALDKEHDVATFGDAANGVQRTAAGGYRFALGADSVTTYAGSNLKEDWAESIRLFLLDRRRGYIGTMLGRNGLREITFAEAYPARARLISEHYGSPYG